MLTPPETLQGKCSLVELKSKENPDIKLQLVGCIESRQSTYETKLRIQIEYDKKDDTFKPLPDNHQSMRVGIKPGGRSALMPIDKFLAANSRKQAL